MGCSATSRGCRYYAFNREFNGDILKIGLTSELTTHGAVISLIRIIRCLKSNFATIKVDIDWFFC